MRRTLARRMTGSMLLIGVLIGGSYAPAQATASDYANSATHWISGMKLPEVAAPAILAGSSNRTVSVPVNDSFLASTRSAASQSLEMISDHGAGVTGVQTVTLAVSAPHDQAAALATHPAKLREEDEV